MTAILVLLIQIIDLSYIWYIQGHTPLNCLLDEKLETVEKVLRIASKSEDTILFFLFFKSEYKTINPASGEMFNT